MWNPFCKSQQPSSAELTQINSKLNTIMAALDDLKAQVARSITVEQSAITLIQGLKAKLDAAIAANDPQALADLSSQLDSEANALSAAITANTPAADEAPAS